MQTCKLMRSAFSTRHTITNLYHNNLDPMTLRTFQEILRDAASFVLYTCHPDGIDRLQKGHEKADEQVFHHA